MHKMTRDPLNLALRRYAGMTLTNLTFGDVANKVPREGVGRAVLTQSGFQGPSGPLPPLPSLKRGKDGHSQSTQRARLSGALLAPEACVCPRLSPDFLGNWPWQ